MPTPPDGFRFSVPIQIRYGDIDRLNHVNNARFLTYIEQARVSYFREVIAWDGGHAREGLIVARITMDYKLPLFMADESVVVWTRCSRIGTKSFDIETLIVRAKDGAVAGVGTTVLVAYDYETNASIPVPESWRQKIRDYEPVWK